MLDLIVKNARLADPAAPRVAPGALGILNGKIEKVFAEGEELPEAAEVIDAQGNLLAPGFIDVHAHLDGAAECGRRALLQGITTSFGGNCGLSPENMEEFFEAQEKGYYVNQAEFVGHSFTLRRAVGLNDPYMPATDEQVGRMCRLAEEALDCGAWGVSFGLDYAPGCCFREVEKLAKISARHDAICPVHTRMFTYSDMYSLTEAIQIGARTGAKVQLSHLVYQYPKKQLLDEAFMLIDHARDQGHFVGVDSGMYTSFAAPAGTATFSPEIIDISGWSLSNMRVSTGMHRGEVLNEALYRYIRKEEPDTELICFDGEPGAVEYALMPEYVTLSTDAGAYRPGEGHPQAAASFPDFFRRMAREQKLLSWNEAVRRVTLLPAETMGLKHKGRLTPGADADLVIFDPETIAGRADFVGLGQPDAVPDGVCCVLIGGKVAAENGRVVNESLGRAIRREGKVS